MSSDQRSFEEMSQKSIPFEREKKLQLRIQSLNCIVRYQDSEIQHLQYLLQSSEDKLTYFRNFMYYLSELPKRRDDREKIKKIISRFDSDSRSGSRYGNDSFHNRRLRENRCRNNFFYNQTYNDLNQPFSYSLRNILDSEDFYYGDL